MARKNAQYTARAKKEIDWGKNMKTMVKLAKELKESNARLQMQ